MDLARRPDPAWLNDYAVGLIRAGRPAEALPVLERARERDPDNPRFAENHAQLLLLRPDTRDRGVEELRGLVARHPAESSAWILLVEAELAAGRAVEAEALLRRARTAGLGRNPGAYLQARLLETRGRRAEAAAAYGALLARDDLDASLQGRIQAARRRLQAPEPR